MNRRIYMAQDPLTLYKLIVLYMLNKVSFPLTIAQISDFILENEYTNFLTLQKIINELTEAHLIDAHSVRNRTHLAITTEGCDTLNFFENRISPAIKQDIHDFFLEKEYKLRNEISIVSDYYKSTSGEYEAHLVAKDKNVPLVEIILSVPSEDTAEAICNNWEKNNEIVYQNLIKQLF